MLMQEQLSTDSFSQTLAEQFQKRSGKEPFRIKAWERFLEFGLPTKKSEAFQYFPLRQLYAEHFVTEDPVINGSWEDFILPECRETLLVFVNGAYCPEHSRLKGLPKQVVVQPLDEAQRSYGAFLQQRMAKILRDERDPFALLNFAQHQRGAFILIPPKVEVDHPIQLLHLITKEGCHASPRIHCFVGSQAHVRYVAGTHSLVSGSFWINGLFDLAIEEGAHCHYTHHSDLEGCWQLEALRATLKRDSSFESVSAITSRARVREDYHVSLGGENARADLRGIWMQRESHHSHTHVHIGHDAPHTHSKQHFKGVLNDTSQSSFTGKIFVRKEAQKTEAYQLNNNLILGERAIASSKPNLEIFADDVKASHGATVSQLDPEQLFYLSSRGLSQETSRRLLVAGFCKEVIETIPYHPLRKKLEEITYDYLAR